MNLALVTVLFLITLFPGFFGQAGYHSGPFSKKFSRSSVFNNATEAVIPSLIYHSIFICIVKKCDWIPNVSFGTIGTLLFNKDTDTAVELFQTNIGDYYNWIVAYILISAVIGYVVGRIMADRIRTWGWDSKYRTFRFDNTWYYTFSAEVLGWRNKLRTKEESIENLKKVRNGEVGVMLDVLVEVDDTAYIYQGNVGNYFLNKDGLDRVHLLGCSRVPYSKVGALHENTIKASDFTSIGDDVVIFRDSMININITYYELIEFDTPEQAASDTDIDVTDVKEDVQENEVEES